MRRLLVDPDEYMLTSREKWDEWFRDLAFRIVDTKVSPSPSVSAVQLFETP
jgi:hypothetical protein